MKRNIFEEMQETFKAEKLLSVAEIPNIDLYMDQLLTLINSKSVKKAPLTKTMVNNYSKEKIITPVKGKKYTKEQILQIYMVFLMKSTLSMVEIKEALSNFYAEGSETQPLEKVYARFLEMAEGDIGEVFTLLQNKFSGPAADPENRQEFFLTLMNVCGYSWLFQEIAQRMIREMIADRETETKTEA
jgi:hypothetical protein